MTGKTRALPIREEPESDRNRTFSLAKNTGFLYYDARLLSHMAEALGKKEDKAKYTEIAKEVAASFNSEYWNESASEYGSNNEAMGCSRFSWA